MRLILTILLIGLFKAEGQMIINASYPYRPYAQPAANLLLDDYPNAAAAYSLRKLDKDYTGAAIRVRKDTTGQPEQDIFFVGNELDTASLKSFLNARSGFVTTWYDQSGNSRNATQSTQANQPRIANLGVIDRQGTRPTVLFDGSNDNFDIAGFMVSSTYSLYYAQKRRASSVRGVYLSGNSSTGGGATFSHWSDNNIYLQYTRSLNWFYKSVSNNTSTFNLLEGYTTGTTQNVYLNNTQLTLSSELSFTSTTSNWNSIGKYTNANFADGNCSEIILYHSDQLSNRSGIATNINTYYSIY